MVRSGPEYVDLVESALVLVIGEPLLVGDIPIAEYVLAYPTGPDNVDEGFVDENFWLVERKPVELELGELEAVLGELELDELELELDELELDPPRLAEVC